MDEHTSLPRRRAGARKLACTTVSVACGAVVLAGVTSPAGHAVITPNPDPFDVSAPTAPPPWPGPYGPGPYGLANQPLAPIGGPRLAERGVIEDPTGPPMPFFDGASYVVADATTGEILAAKDPHGPARPASTQKTLLALTMLPRLDPNSTYVAGHDDESVEGTRVGMAAGQTYMVNDLWYALFLRSGNDSANGIAKAGSGGDLAKAIRMEMAEARRLQAFDTTVVNPSGLDAPGQFSSAYDLALWGRAAIARGDVRKYAGTLKWRFPGNTTPTKQAVDPVMIQVNSENRLLGKYPGIIGVKPGYTSLARNTDIVAAQRDGRTILVTLMGVPHPTVTNEAAAFLDWGFAHAGLVAPVGRLVDPLSASELSPDDDGVAISPVHETPPDRLPMTKVAEAVQKDDLRWSAVSGAAAAALAVTAALIRVVDRRRGRRGIVVN